MSKQSNGNKSVKNKNNIAGFHYDEEKKRYFKIQPYYNMNVNIKQIRHANIQSLKKNLASQEILKSNLVCLTQTQRQKPQRNYKKKIEDYLVSNFKENMFEHGLFVKEFIADYKYFIFRSDEKCFYHGLIENFSKVERENMTYNFSENEKTVRNCFTYDENINGIIGVGKQKSFYVFNNGFKTFFDITDPWCLSKKPNNENIYIGAKKCYVLYNCGRIFKFPSETDILSCSQSSDNDYLYFGCRSGDVNIIDGRLNKKVLNFKHHYTPVLHLKNFGHHLYSADFIGNVYDTDIRKVTETQFYSCLGKLNNMCLSKNGNYLATGNDKNVSIFNSNRKLIFESNGGYVCWNDNIFCRIQNNIAWYSNL